MYNRFADEIKPGQAAKSDVFEKRYIILHGLQQQHVLVNYFLRKQSLYAISNEFDNF
jgi:hypothetical protein